MNFVLVHGSWHGAWCWEKVIPLLEQAGHIVIAPDLPGHGQDRTPIAAITLEAYVDCIVNLLGMLNTPSILLGHSMAGIIISQVAEKVPEKIACLVYLAGFLPQNGESLLSLAKRQKPSKVTSPMRIVPEHNAVYFPSDGMRAFSYHGCDESVFNAISPLFCDEPFLPWVAPVQITPERYGSVKRVYIECEQDQAIHLSSQQRMNALSSCEIFRLNSDHSPFYSEPQGLVEILLKLTNAKT
jgi:pimeloyl-ACP methyl ester carboxylesterase